MICSLAEKGGVIQINFYPVFLDSEFTSVLKVSGIMERGEVIEHEFIMDPADCQKREAWNAVQKELLHLERPSYKLIADHIDHVVSVACQDLADPAEACLTAQSCVDIIHKQGIPVGVIGQHKDIGISGTFKNVRKFWPSCF
mgnify:CR=1 FL=1